MGELMPKKFNTKRIESKISNPLKSKTLTPIFEPDRYADMLVNVGTYFQFPSSEIEKSQLCALVKNYTLPFEVFCIIPTQLQLLKDTKNCVGTLAIIENISVYNDNSWHYGIYLKKRVKGVKVDGGLSGVSCAILEEYNDLEVEESEGKLLHLIKEINKFLDISLPMQLLTEGLLSYATRCSLSFLTKLRIENLMNDNSLEDLCYSQNLLLRLETVLKKCKDHFAKIET